MRGMTAVLAAVLIGAPASAQEPGRAGDTKAAEAAASLQGEFKFVSGEDDGKPVPDEHIKDSLVRITEDTITAVDKDNNDIYVAKYRLDTAKKPWVIMMTTVAGPRGNKGEKASGIVHVDGEEVKLAYAPEGGTVPTEFGTKPETKQLSFVLKRIKK